MDAFALHCIIRCSQAAPRGTEHVWLRFLHSAVQLIPNHLHLVQAEWLRKLQSPIWHSTPSRSVFFKIALPQPGAVPEVTALLKNKGWSPQNHTNQMGWHVSAECCELFYLFIYFFRSVIILQWHTILTKMLQCWIWQKITKIVFFNDHLAGSLYEASVRYQPTVTSQKTAEETFAC